MELDERKIAMIFKAFCDENRLRILKLLSTGEKCACKLLEEINITQPTLSHHMKILCDSGVVVGRKEGKWMHYSISTEGSATAVKYLKALTKITCSDADKSCCEKQAGMPSLGAFLLASFSPVFALIRLVAPIFSRHISFRGLVIFVIICYYIYSTQRSIGMKLISWNVNGIRACLDKGFLETFAALDADFFCLQETKAQSHQVTLELDGYEQFWYSAEKKGYSGTAIFAKHTPISVAYGVGVEELDHEGRLITLEYPNFFLLTCYTPNAQDGLKRLDHRMRWEDAFRAYLQSLDAKKPVIVCGDLNVAHQEIDLKNPKSNRGNAGFSDEERGKFTELLAAGFTDTFRALHPAATGIYSWWSYRYNARANNAGWRIDYFLVSDRLRGQIVETPIYCDVFGSDHCPVGLELSLPIE